MEICGNSGKVREFVLSGKFDCDPALQNNLAVLCSYCNSFFIRCYVYGEFGLMNVPLFEVLPAISHRKVGDIFSVWNAVTPYEPCLVTAWLKSVTELAMCRCDVAVPHSNMYIVVSPICAMVDYLSIEWLNEFLLDLAKRAVSRTVIVCV